MCISAKDKAILRELAQKQITLSKSPGVTNLIREWERFGKMESITRPLFRIELWTFEQDILPPLMRCEGEKARGIERRLLANFVNHELLGDDTIVPDYFGVGTKTAFTAFNLPVKVSKTTVGGKESLGHHFESQISDLDEDFDKLQKSTWHIDVAGTQKEIDLLSELFGDILPVKHENPCLCACPTQDIVHIMSMEDMYISMIDSPELFHEMMKRLTDDYCGFFDEFERLGMLTATTGGQHLNQGSYCYTADLPDKKEHVTLKDVWGFMDSQETTAISPAMFGEFILPYYKKISDTFGLLSYGCCEAVHAIWHGMLDTLTNMRKISISPWCDENKMGEALSGKKIVYLRKPTPNLIGVGTGMDEEAVTKHFRDTLVAARGCHVEFALRDIYAVGSAERAKGYCDLIRQRIDQYWKG